LKVLDNKILLGILESLS